MSKTKNTSAQKRKGRPARYTAAKESDLAKRNNSKKKESNTKRQKWALILFGLSLILGVLTFLKGENFWSILHNGYFGLFGVSTYLVAPLCLLISILLAFDENSIKSIKGKLTQGVFLILLLSGVFHIFSITFPEGNTFVQNIGYLFDKGTEVIGGGIAGSVFGWTLSALFGKVAAAIVIIIVLVISLFLVLGVSVADIVNFFKKLFGKDKKNEKKRVRPEVEPEEEEEEEEAEEEYAPTIDIPLEAETRETVREKKHDKLSRAKAKLLNEEQKVVETAEQDEPENEPPAPEVKIDDLFEKKAPEEEIEYSADENGQTSFYANGEEEKVYTFPPITLLNAPKIQKISDGDNEIQQNAEILIDTLSSFGVNTRLLGATRGPAVTRYELQPSAGVRISRITQLSNDIALNLAATKVRIEAPIPNKAAVGIEVPNSTVSMVTLREILSSPKFKSSSNALEVALGKDISGNVITTDLAKMPHLLIAGTTGSGKSVCTNSMIISLLYKSSPADVKLILIDPKMVEFNIYNGIPHLLTPVVTDPKKAAGSLNWAVNEMENRYTLFAQHNVKDIHSYNELAQSSDVLSHMPKIVIIIDEFADLMMTAPGDVESAVCRLAQKARAAGMHLVIATQRPSVNVITGLIKANITSRIALTVSSQIDSRTIIDSAGAEALLGHGDMLFKPYGSDRMTRIQGSFISEKEIKDVVSYIKNNENADYDQEVIDQIEKYSAGTKNNSSSGEEAADSGDETDVLLKDAIECVIEVGQASTSLLQRKLKVGYARAARLIDEMEERGIVSGYMGSKPREVLITHEQWVEKNMRDSD